MEIKELFEDTREYDVFLGKGWDKWVRVAYTPNGCTIIKTNIEVSPSTLESIFHKIRRKFFSKKARHNDGG